MAIHQVGCIQGHHHDTDCRDSASTNLGAPVPGHEAGCQGRHNPAHNCLPEGGIGTTRLGGTIRPGPQPTRPGPYHAVVRGPEGLDITVSGDGQMFGRILSVIGDTLSAFLDD